LAFAEPGQHLRKGKIKCHIKQLVFSYKFFNKIGFGIASLKPGMLKNLFSPSQQLRLSGFCGYYLSNWYCTPKLAARLGQKNEIGKLQKQIITAMPAPAWRGSSAEYLRRFCSPERATGISH
jgi:hypothetical protein